MMEYEAVRERHDAIRRSVERGRLVASARQARRPLRISVGTGLARLGLLLAGQAAVRAALGEAR